MEKCGILLPIFALPNKYGIGTLGKQAYRFIDFLKTAKQDYWQFLPTNPTSYGDSPYQSFSCYAQNPYFIDLDLLVLDKLLTKKDLKESNLINKTQYIDYGNIFINKIKLLKKAYKKHYLYNKEFNSFKRNNKWLLDYALFMVLKEKNNYKCWNEWEDDYKFRNKKALKNFYKLNKDEVESYMFMQFLYKRQWQNMLRYAHKNKIKLIGDMPIYVAYDSVDVWSNPSLFMLDENYNPTMVAGVPPDYFSTTGQLWGNPLYNYDNMKNDNYSWWVNRIKYALRQTDYVRIDHFRGFSAYYAIPYGNDNAINGKWIKGPGMDLFNCINEQIRNPKIIAENLGLLDDDVYDLIKKTNYPGMRIIEFEMYSKENIEKLKKENPNNILYPGTHDNNTFVSWYNEDASIIEKENTNVELKCNKRTNITNQLIKYCYSFPFKYVIIMMQDILGYDKKARFNIPGSSSNNWTFMFKKSDFNKKVALKLKKIKVKSKIASN